jgi:cell division GTPase FtsZ
MNNKRTLLTKTVKPNVVGFAGVGGCGTNIIEQMFTGMDPAEHPHVRGMAANSDWAQLGAYFDPEAIPAESHLVKWLQADDDKSPQLTVLPLGKTGMGAGMDPEAGRLATTEQETEIEEFFKECHAVFLTGGLGGGTGSGGLPVFAQIAERLEKPRLAIVTMPLAMEGEQKIEKAIEARKKLIALCPTITLYNQKIVTFNVGFQSAWTQINQSCPIPLLAFLREVVRTVARGMNFDLADLRTLLNTGRHIYHGHCVFPEDGEKAMDNVVRSLLNNPFQDERIVKKATRFLIWLRGPQWTMEDCDAIAAGLKAARSSPDTKCEIKWAPDFTATESWIGLLAAAEKGSDDEPQSEHNPVLGAEITHVPAGILAAGNGTSHIEESEIPTGLSVTANNDKFPINCVIDSKATVLMVSANIRDDWSDWRTLKSIMRPEMQYPDLEKTIRAIETETGNLVDPPSHLVSSAAFQSWRDRMERAAALRR